MDKPNKFLGIELASGIKARHMTTYLVVALVTSGYFGGMAMLQAGLLQLMDLDPGYQGLITGYLSTLQEVMFLVLAGAFGVLSDRFGRKAIYVGGLVVAAVGYMLYPHAQNVEMLFAFRFVFGIGGGALTAMLVAVIVDYASDNHRGKANGIQGFVMVLGAFIPLFMAILPKVLVKGGATQLGAITTAFTVMGVLGLAAAALAWVGMKNAVDSHVRETRPGLSRIAGNGLRAALKDPGVALSYGAAFISRGDLAVTGSFMMLWGTQEAKAQLGLEASEAMATASSLMLATIGGALLGSVIMGFIADRVSKARAVSMASGLAAFIYLSMFMVSDPLAGYVKVMLVVMGVAELSAFVTSQALLGQQAPPEQRGAVVGFFGASGALGMLVGTSVGGVLYHKVGPSAPFVMFGALNLIVFLWSLAAAPRIKPPVLQEPAADPIAIGESANETA